EPGRLGMRREGEERHDGEGGKQAFHEVGEVGLALCGHCTIMVSMTSSLTAPLVLSCARSLRSSRRCCRALGPCNWSSVSVRQYARMSWRISAPTASGSAILPLAKTMAASMRIQMSAGEA